MLERLVRNLQLPAPDRSIGADDMIACRQPPAMFSISACRVWLVHHGDKAFVDATAADGNQTLASTGNCVLRDIVAPTKI
ncbi:MAG: hypothetical protein OXC54_09130 [Rhodospirillaceae bacterium]|nr:hypothetical protein [Rhodospirillaceae bacterium]MCY4239029.1 hypothetical protein [Rhodospirillaceae bacterium]MCY4311453.1 hypothetical protein [Rhodospirillaceae bacterium]